MASTQNLLNTNTPRPMTRALSSAHPEQPGLWMEIPYPWKEGLKLSWEYLVPAWALLWGWWTYQGSCTQGRTAAELWSCVRDASTSWAALGELPKAAVFWSITTSSFLPSPTVKVVSLLSRQKHTAFSLPMEWCPIRPCWRAKWAPADMGMGMPWHPNMLFYRVPLRRCCCQPACWGSFHPSTETQRENVSQKETDTHLWCTAPHTQKLYQNGTFLLQEERDQIQQPSVFEVRWTSCLVPWSKGWGELCKPNISGLLIHICA